MNFFILITLIFSLSTAEAENHYKNIYDSCSKKYENIFKNDENYQKEPEIREACSLMARKISNEIKEIKPDHKIDEIKSQVILHIYMPTEQSMKVISKYTDKPSDVIVFHTSVEIFGTEFQLTDKGISRHIPGKTEFGKPIYSLILGYTKKSEDNLNAELEKQSKTKFNGRNYNQNTNNCSSFSNWLSNFLVNHNIPSYLIESSNSY